MNVVVLAGGSSPERDVSWSSGIKICNALIACGHKAILLDVYMGCEIPPEDIPFIFEREVKIIHESIIKETAPDIEVLKKTRPASPDGFFGKNILAICRMADIVFLGLHGENGENGKIQAAFDLLEICYTGSGYLGSALAMDKNITKKLLTDAGIVTPEYKVLKKDQIGNFDTSTVSFPCVVKPASNGSSIGVFIVSDEKELMESLLFAARLEDTLIIEKYIKGREFSVGILKDRVLPVIEIIPREGFYDYTNKYQPGLVEEITPADLDADRTEKLQKLAWEVYGLLGLEVYARIDFLLGSDDRFYCLEANTLPGMTPTSLMPQEAAADGIPYNQLCDRIVTESLRRCGKI